MLMLCHSAKASPDVGRGEEVIGVFGQYEVRGRQGTRQLAQRLSSRKLVGLANGDEDVAGEGCR